MKVLIIGGAGFIGAHLLKKLLNDKKILDIDIIDNFSRAVEDKFLKDLISNDLTRLSRFSEITQIK